MNPDLFANNYYHQGDTGPVCSAGLSRGLTGNAKKLIEHMPVFGARTFIHVRWPRFKCTNCDDGPTTSFHPDWLGKTGKFTKAYEQFFLKMLVNSTIKDIAIKFQTTEEILQGIIDRYIVTEIDWNNFHPTKIGIDEIALKKGHDHYLTI